MPCRFLCKYFTARDEIFRVLLLSHVFQIGQRSAFSIMRRLMRRLMQRDCSDSGNKGRGMVGMSRMSRGMKELRAPVCFGRAPSRCQVSEPALWSSEALAQKFRQQCRMNKRDIKEIILLRSTQFVTPRLMHVL